MVIIGGLICLSAGKIHTGIGNAINFCLLRAWRVPSSHQHWKIGRVLFLCRPSQGVYGLRKMTAVCRGNLSCAKPSALMTGIASHRRLYYYRSVDYSEERFPESTI